MKDHRRLDPLLATPFALSYMTAFTLFRVNAEYFVGDFPNGVVKADGRASRCAYKLFYLPVVREYILHVVAATSLSPQARLLGV